MIVSDPLSPRLLSTPEPSITAFFYQTSKEYPEKLQYVPIGSNGKPIVDPPRCLGFLDYPVFLFNSCNGLLHWVSSLEASRQLHFISNPLTNSSVPFRWPVSSKEWFASGIAFDPSFSDHFRVIVLVEKSGNCLKPMSFSSEKMKWDNFNDTSLMLNTRNRPLCRNRGVFLNGFLYWELEKNSLFAYNVEDQSVKLLDLPLPDELAAKLGFVEPGCLGESAGRLRYCRIMGTVLSVWVGAGTDWVLLRCVNLCQAIRRAPSIKPFGAQALAFLRDREAVLLSVEGKIISCSLDSGDVREVCKVRRNGHGSDYVPPSEFFPFVHSQALSGFNFRVRP